MSMRRFLSSAVLVASSLALALIPASARAGSADDHRLASFQFYTENDTYLRSRTTDEYYTNGIRLAWIRNPNVVSNPEWTERLVEKWCEIGLCPDVPPDIGYGHALGQNMYTPDSIIDPNPQPDDRPWAGYLYYSWLVSATFPSQNENGNDEPVQSLFELQVGLVGPGAGARWAQTTIHRWIDSPKPLGWSNQLKNEPTANLIYLWRKKIGSQSLDVVPHWGAALGNVQTYANAGATVRLGYGITSFPQLIMAPTNNDSPQIGPVEAYLFAGGDGRFVAHNIFLDGNTFRSGPESDIHREKFVIDWKAGAAVRYKAWRFDYTYVKRSEEFDPPSGRAEGAHRFGSIALSYNLWRP
jgi:lipid A 3-O-deacylase